ncbi:hypothetical protein ACFRH4_22175 [Streptomyces mirabilis]|uniref:hypothetical protein n=1 Tax=Streptomyces mirabilis TaxID=68239 RepID=UPI0036C39D57
MKAWISVIRKTMIVNVHGSANAIGGDPRGEEHPLLWALVAAILGGVASGAAEKAAGVLLGG